MSLFYNVLAAACIALCFIPSIFAYFSHLYTCLTCSFVHTTILHPLLAHHHLCYTYCYIYDITLVFYYMCNVAQLKCLWVISLMFAINPLSFVIFDFGFIAFFSHIFVCKWWYVLSYYFNDYDTAHIIFTKPSHSQSMLLLWTCLSLCNTQARAVNLIPAILCDDEGVTQVRGC